MIFNTAFDVNQFPLHRLIMGMFECDNLMFLHEQIPDWEDLPMAEVGKDQATPLHKRFYAALETPTGAEFLRVYQDLIRYIYVGTDLLRSETYPHRDAGPFAPRPNLEDILYQRIPTFRAHIPGNKAVGGKSHRDSDYNHPLGEINFIVPLTPMFGTNSVYTETTPEKADYQFLEGNPGELIKFNGSLCRHGNVPNTTGFTRVSIDFRIIPEHMYDDDFSKDSIAHGLKFTEGQYYERMTWPSL